MTFRRLTRLPILRTVRFSTLRRVRPLSNVFGYDRGGYRVGRYYIDRFLDAHRHDVRGRVLEIAGNEYTTAYGDGRVTQSDILHAVAGNPRATLIGDLSTGAGIPENAFDCIILTQTLMYIYNLGAAVSTLHRILKPGGVVLVTASGISQISRYDQERWGDYWRLTNCSAKRLFSEAFGEANVVVQSFGNVLTAIALLHGLTIEELRQVELDYHDPDYEVLVAVRAVKQLTA
jgi:SAM-dependent methyltransferase